MRKQNSAPHSARLRAGRRSIPGQIYHVRASTYARRAVFSDLASARSVVAGLRCSDELGDTETLAYVVMPDHLHWLMRLTGTRSLAPVVGAVKGVVAHHLGGKVWQAGFFDRAIRREEDIRSVARYIVANPLRAGLVERIEDYPHWDAIWL